MNIAIVAPSPVPFAIGGAERLWSSLASYINAETRHRVEMVKLPVAESNLREIVDGYRDFSRLDLDHFDLVISGKYPGWMVEHRNHVCYMLHTLRGLYDHYPYDERTEPALPDLPGISELMSFLDEHRGQAAALASCFERIEALPWGELSAADMVVCSPLSRRLVHFFDGIGLATGSKSRFAAISATVANRYRELVAPAAFHVVYPPPPSDGYYCGRFDYLFTASRLDRPKRLDLVIEAMRQVTADVELRIAGTGPECDRLAELAAGDDRIRLLGFCSEVELRELYADALAVPFVPFDEDLGLVTFEAMRSGKPVITANDSGGPLEFVRDGVNGLVVEPTAEALAAAITRVCRHPGEAEKLGAEGRCNAAAITWDDSFSSLVAGLEPASRLRSTIAAATPARRKMVVAASFPVYPPRNGGQCRTFHLLKGLAQNFEIDLVTLGPEDQEGHERRIAPGLREIRVPKSAEHQAAEIELSRSVDFVPVTDIGLTRLHEHTPLYGEAVASCLADAQVAVACHPYALPLLGEPGARPLWYEAHNVETDLKRQLLTGDQAECLVDKVREVEAACCRRADLVSVCSGADGERLGELFAVPPSLVSVVPNGVDTRGVRFVAPSERRSAQRLAGLADRTTCVFVGSYHGPNLEAVASILDYAAAMPGVGFAVAGSCCWKYDEADVPANLTLLGVVDDLTLTALLGLADIALNPVSYGSGTNLKMLEYCAAGVPVLSTEEGNRGLSLQDGLHVTLADVADFPAAIERLMATAVSRDRMAYRARSFVEIHYAWSAIAERFYRSSIRHCL